MSRIGRLPVILEKGVKAQLAGDMLKVEGPKGKLELKIPAGFALEMSDAQIEVKRSGDTQQERSLHGLVRKLVANMAEGVGKGFTRVLEINGVGYRVSLAGSDLKFNLGFSHDVLYALPEGVSASIEQNVITISGIDKQAVGQTAAEIRSLKKPEPYKGKGIKYEGERIIRKSGKSGKEK